jgi:hypothetical protein
LHIIRNVQHKRKHLNTFSTSPCPRTRRRGLCGTPLWRESLEWCAVGTAQPQRCSPPAEGTRIQETKRHWTVQLHGNTPPSVQLRASGNVNQLCLLYTPSWISFDYYAQLLIQFDHYTHLADSVWLLHLAESAVSTIHTKLNQLCLLYTHLAESALSTIHT